MLDNRAIGYEKQTANLDKPKGKNYFFGIGIDNYPKFRHLQNAVKDVNDIFNCLATDFGFESLGILANDQATRTAIVDGLVALQNEKRLTENDRLLIYFAGHGKPDENDRNKEFWIPHDGKTGNITSLISNTQLLNIIRFILKPKHILLVCDCWFGDFLMIQSENNEANYTLEQNELNRSRQFFYSGISEVADKGKKETNSPFAASILRQLKNLDDNSINATKLQLLVNEEVGYNFIGLANIRLLQDIGHKLGGDFIFYKQQNCHDSTNKI